MQQSQILFQALPRCPEHHLLWSLCTEPGISTEHSGCVPHPHPKIFKFPSQDSDNSGNIALLPSVWQSLEALCWWPYAVFLIPSHCILLSRLSLCCSPEDLLLKGTYHRVPALVLISLRKQWNASLLGTWGSQTENVIWSSRLCQVGAEGVGLQARCRAWRWNVLDDPNAVGERGGGHALMEKLIKSSSYVFRASKVENVKNEESESVFTSHQTLNVRLILGYIIILCTQKCGSLWFFTTRSLPLSPLS